MDFKCITLHQPHASLVAAGIKKIETRTHERFATLIGRVVGIHAGKMDWPLDPMTAQREDIKEFMKQELPHGLVLCKVRILGMRRLTPNDSFDACVDIDDVRGKTLWGYEIGEVVLLDPPRPAVGRQGIWTYWEEDRG